MAFNFFKIKHTHEFKRFYFCGIKLFKIRKYVKISTAELKNTVCNIKSNLTQIICQQEKTYLRKQNSSILKELHSFDSFRFCPNKGNLGDVFIANSEYQLFKNENLKYKLFIPKKQYNINEQFNFVYGGGIFTNQYKKDYQYVYKTFKNKNLKKCVILPQSFNECDDIISTFDERFTVFCRKKNSYNYLIKKQLKARICIADDMAFNTDLQFYYANTLTKDELINLNNNINEISDKRIKNICKKLFTKYSAAYLKVSGIRVIKNSCGIKTAYLLRNDAEKADITLPRNSFDLSDCGGSNSEDTGFTVILSLLFISAIDCADIVVTDRLHIGIAAALLKKEVFLIDNNYGKIYGVYKQSMKNMENVHFIEFKDLNNIENILRTYKIKTSANNEKLIKMNMNFEKFLTKYLAYSDCTAK